MTNNTVIELDKVDFGYTSDLAIRNVSFSVQAGDFLGIIGPNGGGKTTLLRLVLGMLCPIHGNVLLLGDTPRKTRHNAGYVPQETNINKEFPIIVHDVVMTGLTTSKGFWRPFTKQQHMQADAILDKHGLLPFRKRRISELSGGQRQKVLLSRALVSNPSILFLDEPTASVDTTGEDEIYQHLVAINNAGTTIVLVTHNIGVMSKYIKSVACVNRHLHYHPDGKLDEMSVVDTFGCTVDIIAHGLPHRVFQSHHNCKDCHD
ncbi:MAG: metal ABC transporter ATP-binding protein [Fibrobacterota bacterium]